jgi:transcriptional regulator with XRE-family HTH domain
VDPKEFIKKQIEGGVSQTEVANKVGVSNATVYKMLYTKTTLTLETIKKIAKAYHKPIGFFIGEEDTQWSKTEGRGLSKKEEQLLSAFCQLDERRQERIMESIEDMLLALRESQGKEGQEKESKGLNSERKSNG